MPAAGTHAHALQRRPRWPRQPAPRVTFTCATLASTAAMRIWCPLASAVRGSRIRSMPTLACHVHALGPGSACRLTPQRRVLRVELPFFHNSSPTCVCCRLPRAKNGTQIPARASARHLFAASAYLWPPVSRLRCAGVHRGAEDWRLLRPKYSQLFVFLWYRVCSFAQSFECLFLQQGPMTFT